MCDAACKDAKFCKICACRIGSRASSGMCRQCYCDERYKSLKRGTCKDCGNSLGPSNSTGVCSACNSKRLREDPEIHARRLAGIRRKFEDPEFMARARRNCSILGYLSARDPEIMARRSALAKARYPNVLGRPDIKAKTIAAVKEKSGPKQSETKMAWCPREYRDEYRRLVYNKKIPGPVARAMILEQVAADEAKLSPFERQLKALQNGAPLIANDQKPSLANPGVYGDVA